jgi:tetratricopeptide (TPR) repeat protein
VQCKLKGYSAALNRQEIEDEVNKARTFKPGLSKFLIATTAPRDVAVQEAARLLTVEQLKKRSFPVVVVSWEDVVLLLEDFPDLMTKYYSGLFGVGAPSAEVSIDVAVVEPRAAEIFVGREPELAELAAALLHEGATRAVAICSVQGMPGVGKSYLAERFAYLYRDLFPGGTFRIALDPAEDSSPTAESLLSALADSLKLPAGSVAALAVRVRERLLQPRSLLHVENVDSENLACVAGQLITRLSDCPVLVSGRFQGLGKSQRWTQVRVMPFDEVTALDQLTQELALGNDTPREPEAAYRRLVHALGFLPLAVHLGAGHLLAGRTVDGFLQSFRATGYALPPADPLSLSAEETRTLLKSTFTLSLDLLRDELGGDGDCLTGGFAALGHASASGVGNSLGASLCDLQELDFENLAVTARRLSLLEAIPTAERPDRAYRMHPLLAEFLRARSGPVAETEILARMTEWFCTRLVYEQLGDMRSRALAMGRIADILQTRGDLEEALRIRREEQLPVYERLGDVRSRAVTMGKIADVLQARGDLEEALRIRREEQLPVYERLGDVWERSVTLGKIADVLHARGHLEEALRIRRKEIDPG